MFGVLLAIVTIKGLHQGLVIQVIKMSMAVWVRACVRSYYKGLNVQGIVKRQPLAFGYLLQVIGLASATGGYWVLVCNVGIFLLK